MARKDRDLESQERFRANQ